MGVFQSGFLHGGIYGIPQTDDQPDQRFHCMRIDYQNGDATRPSGDRPRIIVHVCNDSGGWGKGFVLALSYRWREPERRYRAWHLGEQSQPFALGQVQFVRVEDALWVANLIGQHGMGFRNGLPPIRYEAIQEGLRTVAAKAIELGASVHMPRIGCGLAGGEWKEVERIVCQELVASRVAVTVYDLPKYRISESKMPVRGRSTKSKLFATIGRHGNWSGKSTASCLSALPKARIRRGC